MTKCLKRRNISRINKMDNITVTMNGSELSGHDSMTILELAQENGIDIPTLCHSPDLTPLGA